MTSLLMLFFLYSSMAALSFGAMDMENGETALGWRAHGLEVSILDGMT